MTEVDPKTLSWQEHTVRVAAYTRNLPVSLARIWENVLDWEHLPWLHRSAFASIELESASQAGWRARIGVATGRGPVMLRTEVVLDRPALRYVTRTLEGPGAGTEIWTQLSPEADRRTRIDVSFQLRADDPARAAAAGERLVQTYTQLWNEDEAMMVRRQAHLDALAASGPAAQARGSIALGPLAALRRKVPFIVEAFSTRVRVQAIDGQLYAYTLVCPHLGGPLEEASEQDGCVVCPWHGYRFDLRTGRSADDRGLFFAPRFAVRVDDATGAVCLERMERGA
jgi:nitrite reductase/ring-hydroxylating ferredoxin subunit